MKIAGGDVYAAANSFLDGLAAHRRSLGLAALTIQWGAIAEVGVVSRDAQVDTHLRSIGLTPIAPDQGLEELGIALEEGFADRGIIDIDWVRWMRTAPETRWNRLELVAEPGGQQGGRRELFAKEIGALPGEQRGAAVALAVAAAVAPIFKLLPEAFELSKSLKDYGMDSLMALEVQVALEEKLGVEMSTMELLAGRSVQSLALAILKRVSEASDGAPASGVVRNATAVPSGDLSSYFLERICVQRPYFALSDISRDGEWLVASAQPTLPRASEGGAVSLAEAARHTAILGSCAARQRDPRAGRIYYPVRTAELVSMDRTLSVPLSNVVVRARATGYDAKSAVARAEAQMLSRDGQLVCAFDNALPRRSESRSRARVDITPSAFCSFGVLLKKNHDRARLRGRGPRLPSDVR